MHGDWNNYVVLLCAFNAVSSLSLFMYLFLSGNYNSAPNNESYFKLALQCCLQVSFWEAWFLRPSLALYQRENISRLVLPGEAPEMAGGKPHERVKTASADSSKVCNSFADIGRNFRNLMEKQIGAVRSFTWKRKAKALGEDLPQGQTLAVCGLFQGSLFESI